MNRFSEAGECWLINAAFCDILAGNFASYNVHEALKLGHRAEYAQLKAERDIAECAARQCGG